MQQSGKVKLFYIDMNLHSPCIPVSMVSPKPMTTGMMKCHNIEYCMSERPNMGTGMQREHSLIHVEKVIPTVVLVVVAFTSSSGSSSQSRLQDQCSYEMPQQRAATTRYTIVRCVYCVYVMGVTRACMLCSYLRALCGFYTFYTCICMHVHLHV